MRRLFRVVFSVIAAVAVAALITAAVMVQSSRASLERVYHSAEVELVLPADDASIEEGHRLYRAYGCVGCHLEDGGGRVVVSSGIGYVAAPDLTLVANAWSIPDLERVLRHGLLPSGTPALLMPSQDYWPIDDVQTAAILAYLRTLPVAGRSYGPSSLTLMGHLLHAVDALPAVSAEHVVHGARRPPMGAPGSIELGRTLGRMCVDCHGEHLSGGVRPWEDAAEIGMPSNLTPDASGLAAWSEEQFRVAMRTGATPDGRTLDPRVMPWEASYQYFTDDELHSLWLFLAEQPPMPFGQR